MIQKYKIYLQIIILFVAFSTTLHSQEDESNTKGTEFWLTFLPNFHNNIGNSLSKYDSLYILIAADEVTSGKIVYRNNSGQQFESSFTITNPENVYKFKLSWEDYELEGFNASGSIVVNHQNEEIAPQSFKITTDKGVNVYAHSQAVTTSEACTVYPLEALDTEYYVLSYNSDASLFGGSITGQSTPSQYAIVAPYDNTIVEIENSVRTWNNTNRFQTITMNAGDVYLVQSYISIIFPNNDLSGSKISSNNPVAVFSGHQRAKVPVGNGASRDMLFEQIPSNNSLGREYIVTPFSQPDNITTDNSDVFRVMAIENNTNIEFSVGQDVTLDAGEFIERNLLSPVYVKSNKIIVVAAYKKTSQSGSISADGDPFMIILPPVEKFSNKYRFLNIQVPNPNNNFNNAYNYQHITIVTDNRNLTKEEITIDGVAVLPDSFIPIPETNYSYANILVGDGNHSVEGIYNFSVLVYGFGYADSYGYMAGMNYKGDQVLPKFQSLEDCFRIEGSITDSTYLDTGLKEVLNVEEESFNTVTLIEEFEIPSDVVTFESELDNIYLDGVTVIRATDVSDLSATKKYDIKGFTVALSNFADYSDGDEVLLISDTTQINEDYCITITLFNYGKFPQEIRDINLSNTEFFYLNATPPFTIEPGNEIKIDICFTGGDIDIYATEVSIKGECEDRDLAMIDLFVLGDDVPPEITAKPDECYDLIEVFVTDSLKYDSGIKQINIIENNNCEIRVRNESRERFDIAVYIIDKKQDASYIIEAIDSMGNSSSYEGIVQGFTLDFESITSYEEGDFEVYIDFGGQPVGNVVCDTISIHNYGTMPFVISKPDFYEHIYFSTPEKEFPLNIAPGETGRFPVCFRSILVKDEQYIDTLYFEHNCEVFKIPLNAVSDTLFVNTDGRCEVPVQLTLTEVPEDYFVMQNYPNPFDETTVITLGMPSQSRVIIDIYNSFGEHVKSIADVTLNKGVYKFEFNKFDLPQGVYFYDVRMNSYREVRKMLIQ